jgi:hypothetical protein
LHTHWRNQRRSANDIVVVRLNAQSHTIERERESLPFTRPPNSIAGKPIVAGANRYVHRQLILDRHSARPTTIACRMAKHRARRSSTCHGAESRTLS